MKKIFALVFAILLIAGIVYAKCTGYYCGAVSTSTGDSYLFRWNGDHASGTSYAYTNSGGGSAQGTVESGALVDTTHAHSGNAIGILDSQDKIKWESSVSNYVTTSEGSLELWAYIDDTEISGTTPLFEFYATGGANYIVARVSNGAVYMQHRGNNVAVSMTTANTIPAQTYTRVRFRWSVTNNLISVQIGANSWENDSDADAVTAFATVPTVLYIGRGVMSYTVDYPIYIDDFESIGSYNTFND